MTQTTASSEGGAQSNGTASTVPFIINGEEYIPEKKFDVISPATGKLLHQCGSASVADADAAVSAAAAASKTWRNTSPKVRRDIFLKAAAVMERRRDELVKCMGEETGATAEWCSINLSIAVDFITDVAGRVATLEGSFPTTRDPEFSGIVMKEPYGVVLSIAPWYVPWPSSLPTAPSNARLGTHRTSLVPVRWHGPSQQAIQLY